jgi:hypothetical protein
MRFFNTATLVCLTLAGQVSADNNVAPANCISFADAGAALILWQDPVVRDHFEQAEEISVQHQHSIVNNSCSLVQDSIDYPGQGASSDFFTFVELSEMYVIWKELGVLDLESDVNRFGLYAALHELSHGRTVP